MEEEYILLLPRTLTLCGDRDLPEGVSSWSPEKRGFICLPSSKVLGNATLGSCSTPASSWGPGCMPGSKSGFSALLVFPVAQQARVCGDKMRDNVPDSPSIHYVPRPFLHVLLEK